MTQWMMVDIYLRSVKPGIGTDEPLSEGEAPGSVAYDVVAVAVAVVGQRRKEKDKGRKENLYRC